MKKDIISIINKKAKFNYFIEDEYTAGIVLTGSEIKSIRRRNVSISDSFCEFNNNNELFISKMYIKEYQNSAYSRNSLSQRKLLLNRKELKKLKKQITDVGLTIIPLKLFINDSGLAKIKIALAKGKKIYDKRQSLKEKELKRDLERSRKK
ncbi:MAG: SsrA-binding protein SmpB [Flavobacteriales bacterium]|nr:MAG: SsrA-binding protein SmpB [Flavobacteriales bacterium]